MAVTGAIFNSLVFGGVNSADYGIYITGEAVFNAPKRAVETVSVPGRNGDIIIDQGHWKNIEVTYPAGTFGMSETEFRTALSDFRNAVVSQLGYQRLSDTYHPDEYRMATYVEGLEVDAKNSNKAGQFSLVFNCKPQRWLTSGETAVTVASGDTLTNPTLYASSPFLSVKGYGTINLGEHQIDLEDGAVGNIQVATGRSGFLRFNEDYLNAGDMIRVNACKAEMRLRYTPSSSASFRNLTVNSVAGDGSATARFSSVTSPILNFNWAGLSFEKGTPSTKQAVVGVSGQVNISNTWHSFSCDITVTVTYTENTDYGYGELSLSRSFVYSGYTAGMTVYLTSNKFTDVVTESTQSYLGEITYIDCAAGEAYREDDGIYTSLNSFIDLGSDLPVLDAGINEITFDSTITELVVTPRWWKL